MSRTPTLPPGTEENSCSFPVEYCCEAKEVIVMAEDMETPWKTFQKLLLSLSKCKVSSVQFSRSVVSDSL